MPRKSYVALVAGRSMIVVLALAAAVGTLAAPSAPRPTRRAADPAPAADELTGLWKAKRRFGPDARGPLVIQRTGTTYTADMMGQILPVRVEGNELTFGLPGGQGTFRGRLEAGRGISGSWIPAASVAMGGRVSPVHLDPNGPNRWTGQVVPFDDVFTFYLLVQPQPDGSFSALLRNPERDFGSLLGVSRLVREGNIVKLLGKRLGQPNESVAASGSYDPEDSVITLGFSSRGGSYDFRRDDEHSEFYPRGKNPGRYAYSPPLARNDGWPASTLEAVGIDRAPVESFVQAILEMRMDSLDAPQTHGVLIARHGKLVFEEYFHGENRDRLHETRSATKSLTATIVGAAMQAGTRLKLSTPVYELMNGGTFPADLEPRKRAMTLEHLLSMSSGFFCDDNNPDAPGNESTMNNQTEEPDFYRFTMKVPMAWTSGEKAIYCSANPNLALGMVARATGESPLYTFDRLVAQPLKITHYGWPTDGVNHPYGGGGVHLLPRDFMKLGQLMLNGGIWTGRRILSREFVNRASAPLYQLGSRKYGLSWWGMDYPFRGRTIHVYAALGNGGNVVLIMPELDVVIAHYGANYASQGYRWFTDEAIPRFILPAIR